MCPQGLALHHPAAEILLGYVSQGCPTQTGRPWTWEEITVAIHKGPHILALDSKTMEILADEVREKIKQGGGIQNYS